MIKSKFLSIAFIALLLSLAACGSSAKDSPNAGSKVSESTILSFVLKNDKTIDCVVADGNKSGSMDCGWDAVYESDLKAADNPELLSEVVLTNAEGREVRCVEASGTYLSGISCDWSAK